MEEEVAVEGDHSTMVKFSSKNNVDYMKVLGTLHRFENEAKAVVERQFCSGMCQLVEDNWLSKIDTVLSRI